jgi:hypothetical protein
MRFSLLENFTIFSLLFFMALVSHIDFLIIIDHCSTDTMNHDVDELAVAANDSSLFTSNNKA